jgi:hypothetical protein
VHIAGGESCHDLHLLLSLLWLRWFLTAAAGWMYFGGHGRVDGPITKRQDAVSHEWRLAYAEHKNIAEAVAACSGITYLAGQPASIREQCGSTFCPTAAGATRTRRKHARRERSRRSPLRSQRAP